MSQRRAKWAGLGLVAVTACGTGQRATAPRAAPPSAEISATELRRHVDALSADSMAGRATLDVGEKSAADYLAAEFRAFGLAPLPGHDFVLPAALRRRSFDEGSTQATLLIGGEERRLEAGVDFKPFWFSKAGRTRAEVIFAGYGISNPSLSYDDYKGLDVTGKIVFVLRGAPRTTANDKRFDHTTDALFTTKAALAKKRGAVGMILVTDPRTLRGRKRHEDLRLHADLSLPAKLDGTTWGEIHTFFGRLLGSSRGSPSIYAIHIRSSVGDVLGSYTPQGNLLQAQVALDHGLATPASLPFGESIQLLVSVGAPRGTDTVSARNVAAILQGSDPQVRDQWIVIGAHYDHLGRYSGDGDTVYNGADDNASGTAAMLDIARVMAQGERPRRSVVFVGFTAEEKGLLGSRVLSRGLLGREHVSFMINMDMIGRNPKRPITVEGDGFASGLKTIVERVNADLFGTEV